MDWIGFLILAALIYAAVAYVIHSQKLFPAHVTFYGPILAVRSQKVGFLDRFIPHARILRAYGTLSAITVVMISIIMVALLLFSLFYVIEFRPPPTAVNDPLNIFAIPGVNEFIPFTIPVWTALMITLIVHEFGHGILARIENIRVKFIGVLLLVIPIGAFVEPDDEEFGKAPKISRIRMLGAGITNNLVAGLISFILFIGLLGMAVPCDTPLIKAVYVDYPAAGAGVPPNSVITAINGEEVGSRSEVSSILDLTKPGETVTLAVIKDGQQTIHPMTLSAWPEALGDGGGSGFMGVAYYNGDGIRGVFDALKSPLGLFTVLAIPLQVILDPDNFGFFVILLNDTVDTVGWITPFPHFWTVVQLLFWCAWFNLMVALCNALPMVPLDGGYILKEGTEHLLQRFGIQNYTGNVVITVSFMILFVLALVFSLPHFFTL